MTEPFALLDLALTTDRDPAERRWAILALLDAPLTGPARAPLLGAWRTLLADPSIDSDLRDLVRGRVIRAEPGPEPEYLAALCDALLRETDVEAMELGHAHLRQVETDPARLAPVLMQLWFRFLAHFPREPLHGWLREFHDWAPLLPEVRARLPRIAALAEADWVLDRAEPAADPAEFLPGLLEAVAARQEGRAQARLERAWQTRSVRRRDLGMALDKVLDCPGLDGLRKRMLDLLEEGGAVDAAVVDRCLRSLGERPQDAATYEVRQFLARAGPRCPDYAGRVLAAFTQRGYSRWCRAQCDPGDWARVPASFNDWEYAGWRLTHSGWPIAHLWMDLEPWDEVTRVLSAPVEEGVSACRSLAYVVLERLWRRPGEEWTRWCRRPLEAVGAVLRGLAALLGQMEGRPELDPLRDRAALLFARQWPDYLERLHDRPVPSELARAAADAWIELLRRFDRYATRGERPPAPPRGMDRERARAIWPFDEERWGDGPTE